MLGGRPTDTGAPVNMVDRSMLASKMWNWIDRPSTVGRPLSDAEGVVSGVGGNSRLTSATGIVLLALLAVEGVTILSVRQMITLHIYVGILLLGPVLLKSGSTMYRFVRYYRGAPAYLKKGPPHPRIRRPVRRPCTADPGTVCHPVQPGAARYRDHADLSGTAALGSDADAAPDGLLDLGGADDGACRRPCRRCGHHVMGGDSELSAGQGGSAAALAIRADRPLPGTGRLRGQHPVAPCDVLDQPNLRTSRTAAPRRLRPAQARVANGTTFG